MAAAPILAETVEVPTSVLIEACAEMLAIEDRLVEFCGGQESPTTEALSLHVHNLLDAAGAHVNTGTHPGDGYQHPVLVEAYAREQELLGEQDLADRIRTVGDGRAQWDTWMEEMAARDA